MAIGSVSKSSITNGFQKNARLWDEPAIGSAFGGGYYAGIITQGGVWYYLIIAPKASGESSSKTWKTTNTTGPAATVTLNNGPAASASMNSATYPAAQFCEDLSIGGYTDWYLPSRDELELCYRNFKPGTTANGTTKTLSTYVYPENNDVSGDGRGVNRNSYPAGSAYTSSVPAQTSVTAFKTGGTEAFAALGYWSSTEYSSTNAWGQSFGNGAQYGTSDKASSFYVRAVRRIQIQFYRVEPPVISTPADLATSIGRVATITAGSFAITPADTDTHVSSDWQVATDQGFTNVVVTATADTTNKTSITPALNQLAGNTTHYVRVRYNGATKSSVWSQPITFTTGVGAAAPSITSPTAGATDQSRTLTLTASAFSSDDSSTHASSDWQIATDSGFASVVWSSTADSTNKTSIAVSPALPAGTYYARVRYNSTSGASLWSATISFTTVTTITTPSITSPTSGATGQSRMLTVSANAFAQTSDTDTHVSSDWQFASDSGFATIAYQSLANTTNKTSIQPTLNSLLGNTTYYVRVRYNGRTGNTSGWSSTVTFTTSVGAAAPAISAPTNNAKSVSRGPEITAGAFSSNDSSTHTSSDWQIASDSDFATIVYQSLSDTANKTTITVPADTLSTNIVYCARVRYTSTTGSSLWSPTVAFTTRPNIGESFGGGYYPGTIVISTVNYYLAVSPAASGQNTSKQWKTTTTITGATSVNDGLTNSNNMNNTTHPAAYFCRGLTTGGYSDWYLPAKDELELCYRNLKPDTTANDTTFGANSNSNPTGSNYTASVPTQTSVTAFKTGGTEAFAASVYWSSTEYSITLAWYQIFGNGFQGFSTNKTNSLYVRAVRKVQALVLNQPVITSPAAGATGVYGSPTITASAFTSSDGSTHTSSDWQIATDSGFTTVVWSSTADTVNKTSTVPKTVFLKPSTAYYVRVRYNSSTSVTSAWSNAVSFTTGTATPAIGSTLAGGYYTGTIVISSVNYHVIVSPKASGDSGGANKQWKTTNTTTTGTTSVNDGLTNSNAMNNTTHPAAYFCRGLTTGGYSDWYLPAKDELELCYRNLKPNTTANSTSSGANSSSNPTGSTYTASVPAQTTVTDFKTGRTEAFAADYYWSSTEYSSSGAWYQLFFNGSQGSYANGKTYSLYVRAVRKIQVL